MDPIVSEVMNLVFRWIHVVAAVMWIGHLWFFNFVNAQFATKYDAESKKKLLPELMPRALYWFRWGAAYTWLTGVLMLGTVIYMGGVIPDEGKGMAIGVGVAVVLLAFGPYDLLWKSPAAKNPMVGAGISFALVAAVAFGLSLIMPGRAVWIHVGSMFGTIMAMNVWMRIWPAQRKLIAAVAGTGPAADPAVAALSGLRSKHNTYMSVPLILTMISSHFPTVFGNNFGWAILMGCIAIGWGAVKFLYTKSASAAPASYT